MVHPKVLGMTTGSTELSVTLTMEAIFDSKWLYCTAENNVSNGPVYSNMADIRLQGKYLYV